MTLRTGVLWAMSASIAFGLAAFASKQAAAFVDATQVALFRYVLGVAFVAAITAAGKPLLPVAWRLLCARGVLGGGAGLLYYLSLNHIPVGTATFLNCTSPIFAAGFAVLFLGERLRGARLAAFVVCIVGVLTVVVGQGATLGGPVGWQIAALLSGVAAGGAVVAIRAARRTDGPWELFLFFALFGAALSLPFAIANWRSPAEGALLTTMTWLGAAGGLSLYGQIALTVSLGAIEAPVAAGLSQLTVVTSVLLGVAFQDERFGTWAIAGAFVTASGVVFLAAATARPGRLTMGQR